MLKRLLLLVILLAACDSPTGPVLEIERVSVERVSLDVLLILEELRQRDPGGDIVL